MPKNQKTKDQKYGLVLGSSHDSDLKTDDKDKTKLAIKPLHLHFDVLLEAGITYSKAIKLFQPSRDENLKMLVQKISIRGISYMQVNRHLRDISTCMVKII